MTAILNKPVLVLNKSWTVIGTTSTKDAIDLMCRDSARALCTTSFLTYSWEDWISGENTPEVTSYIKTPSIDVPAPQVVILTKYGKLHRASVKFSSRAIYRRDDYRCQYCLKQFKKDELSLDHVIPKSRNGGNTWENCVTSCLRCNNKKADRTPVEAGLKLPRKPVRPKWNPVLGVKKESRPQSWKPLLKENW